MYNDIYIFVFKNEANDLCKQYRNEACRCKYIKLIQLKLFSLNTIY